VETQRIYVTGMNCTVNRNECRTGYSSVLICLTAVFRDSTGLLYPTCLDMTEREPRCCELGKMNKAAYSIGISEPGNFAGRQLVTS
jgi:hypothetical protein